MAVLARQAPGVDTPDSPTFALALSVHVMGGRARRSCESWARS
jgi:hypothetical protein